MPRNAAKIKLDNEWYGAKKKHYTPSETISWATKSLKEAEKDFAELASAIGNRKKPIPPKFFKVFAISDKKCLSIFKLLRPRRFASLVEAVSELSEKGRRQFWSKTFNPYLRDWEQTITFIENRLPGQAKVIELRQTFSSISTLQHELLTDPDSATKDAIKRYMDIFDKLWPIWEMLATVLPVGRSIHAASGFTRGKYDKYCLGNTALAQMFEVDIKTISRWKKEDSQLAEDFRKQKNSPTGMARLAMIYQGNRAISRKRRVQGKKSTTRERYDETRDYYDQFAKPINYVNSDHK